MSATYPCPYDQSPTALDTNLHGFYFLYEFGLYSKSTLDGEEIPTIVFVSWCVQLP